LSYRGQKTWGSKQLRTVEAREPYYFVKKFQKICKLSRVKRRTKEDKKEGAEEEEGEYYSSIPGKIG